MSDRRNFVTSIGITLSILAFVTLISYVVSTVAPVRGMKSLRAPIYCPEDTDYQVNIDYDTVYVWDCQRLVGKYALKDSAMSTGLDSVIYRDNE